MTILPGSWVMHETLDAELDRTLIVHQALYQHDAQSVALDIGNDQVRVLHHDQIVAIYPEDYPLPLPKSIRPPILMQEGGKLGDI